MKLYELKQGDTFTINGKRYIFNRLDGMYAKCTNVEHDVPIMILAGLEVENDSTN